MEKQSPSTCKHYLRLRWRKSERNPRENTLWASCRFCPRTWFLGTDAQQIATEQAGTR